MKFDATIFGDRVVFLNPPNNGLPNLTFMAELPDTDCAEGHLDPLDKWYDITRKLVLEMNYDLIILDTRSWVTGYIPSATEERSFRESNMVTVNYRTMSSQAYAGIMMSNVIRRYPIDSGFVHDNRSRLKYTYTMDFVHCKNKNSPVISNGFIDVVISMVYLPETENEIINYICTMVYSSILKRIYSSGIVPMILKPLLDAHVVGYDANSGCVEMVFTLNGIGYDESNNDYYVIDEMSKDCFIVDERLSKDSIPLIRALSNTIFMDKHGFDVVSNLYCASDTEISLIRESDGKGRKTIMFIPHFIRYELHDFDYNDTLLNESKRRRKDGTEPEEMHYYLNDRDWNSDWCKQYRPIYYRTNYPVLIEKVARDIYGNKALPKPPSVVAKDMIFAVDAHYYWIAWYALIDLKGD